MIDGPAHSRGSHHFPKCPIIPKVLRTLDTFANVARMTVVLVESRVSRFALFFTGSKHAGENLAEVLRQRTHEPPTTIQMCDALSRNTPKGVETLIANCLAHGRRQVVELVDHFPEECRYVLEALGGVYHNDAVARERALSPEERQHFHLTRLARPDAA